MDTLPPTPRNPDELRTDGVPSRRRRFHRLGRLGVVLLAVLVLHVIAVVWIARSRQVTWPPAPEQIIPALLLHPEPVHPPAPPPPRTTARQRPAPHPRPQAAPTPAPTPAPDLASMDPSEFTSAGAQASGDTGVVRDLSGDGPAGPPAVGGDGFSLPPSATLRYATYVNGVRNEDGVIRWATDGKTYTLAVEIPLPLFFGTLAFRSAGTVGAYGLTPTRYEEVRGRRQPDVTTFHYATEQGPASGTQSASTVTFSRTPTVLPLPEGTQDRFSVFLQLTGLARGGPERIASPGLTLEFPIADTDSVEVARVQHIGEESVDTPNGTIRAQHFIRLARRADDKRRVEIWLSPDHGWLPVRLRQTEPNGMQFDLVYQSQEGG
ncbi:DUF3108 domain-containing protein [Ralstonia flatus]|uniref:DUF3108 domain-containing protein n=1 Tax=Ralstonia flatus TaxID=3058601 RepID=UPI001981C58C|nr:DUF3108 domain-containing protein [Ralstonia sp. LMG 32965]MBN6208418.1 DUF3108 domain-containing protein [Ralstonia pickettii]